MISKLSAATLSTFLVLLLIVNSNGFNMYPTSSRRTSSLHMTKLSYNGKKVEVKAGSPLKNAVGKLGIKPRYSCKKGDCGTCAITIGGSRVKVCVGKVPPEPNLKSLKENGLAVRP
mmetsp:Transcript_9943/g.11630  ORF Transcript_9943/g.11630 Transcript_9943/m.11630 type:complete len:116 (+) Transcript_9943:97-444(+)|eukprot:CAMPEP_0198263696 /NCGR_PEP_ID=MMETSP1447-20131203/13414_1 /TAXON_ID=420782 /ORGANISM="Chaetoceros dichaeta, Strain CCMP1751" /LENGTH=115 /DNA_ID=CAMNT_0043952405 /DNA_START=94 /DNA_END=441 /DNA_ORIENTATION=-